MVYLKTKGIRSKSKISLLPFQAQNQPFFKNKNPALLHVIADKAGF